MTEIVINVNLSYLAVVKSCLRPITILLPSLSIIGKGILKSPTICMGVSTPFSYINLCFMYFEALLLVTYTFKMTLCFLEKLII